ncbi:response regulator containing a CheY-like receiver domain and an HTH DNA-binding domain [Acidovorax sp. CF316]|uniref:response regulator n=1 Tax=Acidovorax sp. CF316 TaxID=1144317 RepID=UPI00026BC7D1|nr:response regulator [Acidovorax sp. CF316]EJE50154.1 response regulator containing a CheY-like receiver domain and an HTH DNA-binding domain [Acidovorax sp. CF316]
MPFITILVEDNKMISETLVPALEELANARVVAIAATATGARHALERWHGQWQLMVVDLFLAAGSGLEVLQAVRQRNPGQHVYVLSNYATPDMRRRCQALGADGVFDKSTELDAFFAQCMALPDPAPG